MAALGPPQPGAIIISASQYYAMLICNAMNYLVRLHFAIYVLQIYVDSQINVGLFSKVALYIPSPPQSKWNKMFRLVVGGLTVLAT